MQDQQENGVPTTEPAAPAPAAPEAAKQEPADATDTVPATENPTPTSSPQETGTGTEQAA